LDLDCGSDNHIVCLSRNKFSVFELDNSPEGLKITRQWLREEGLESDLRLQTMTEKLPHENGFFDAVMSVQMIRHADISTIKGIVKEVNRVLNKNGFLFITVPNIRYQGTTFRQIEPNTFILLDSPEKGPPHHYFTPKELKEVFGDFEIVDAHLDTWDH